MTDALAHRCYLFVPGDSARKQARALESGADALILDLEDAVAPGAKAEARATVAAFLARPAPMARFVRVNGFDSGETAADVAATAALAPAGFVLPKCAGPDDVSRLATLVDAHGGLGLPIIAIATETVRALRRLLREDWSHPRLSGLAWGAEDLAADLGAARNRGDDGAYLGPFLAARDATLLAAHEAGVAALDAVFTDFRDAAGLVAETEAGRDLGFGAKMAIHPAQVGPIQAAFRPSEEQIAHARAVLDALGAAGGGVATLAGRMLDRPHVVAARRLLRRAGIDPDAG